MINKLSGIFEDGKEEAQQIINNISTIESEETWQNKLFHGDNLLAMQKLLASGQEVDLIYIDPPFDSKANYYTHDSFAYTDKWNKGTEGYLRMLVPRLILMRELLSDNGSIYCHVDWHASHYVRLLLDEIFGKDNFANEIVWSYKSGGASKKQFSRKHDTIFFYRKSKDYIFNVLKEKSYNSGFKSYGFKGIEQFEDEIGWYTVVNMKDVWQISMVGRTSSERVNYPTQKPVKLLERIICASSNKGDLVADFFCGSGTTGVVAESLGRRWIMCDIGEIAIETTKERLPNQGAKPFKTEVVK